MPDTEFNISDPLSLNPIADLYGKILFQGPMFQNIESFYELSQKHCVAKINTENSLRLLSEDSGYKEIFGSAKIRDAFLHAVQLCVPDYKILPISIEDIKLCFT